MNFLEKIKSGNSGETKVISQLEKFLNEFAYIKQHFQIPTLNSSKEIDILLFHPSLGLFIIEVKNYNHPNEIKQSDFIQAKQYKNLILSYLNEHLKKTYLNIEFKVIYPKLSKYKSKVPFGYENHAIFKEDLENLDKLFQTTNNYVPSSKEIQQIIKLLNLNTKTNVPIISHNQIKYFDYKQLSALNGYTGGFRLIRGVAGSGKTQLLTNFANQKSNSKILILAFNSNLVKKIKSQIRNPNAKVISMFKLLKEINIKTPHTNDFNLKFKFIKNNISKIHLNLKNYQQKHNFDYLLVDEAQDFEAGLLRSLIENFKNSLIFIDEAQKFYTYSLNDFSEVTKHPYFEKELSVKGRRTISLKNIYRTPNNIAKAAIEIVKKDKNINNYYKKIKFIKNDLSKDIKFILNSGEIFLTTFNNDKIQQIINSIPKNETYLILTFKDSKKNNLSKTFKNVHTISSSKGLEADHIIVDDFVNFLSKNTENEIFYRQIYVILTRAKKNIYIDISSTNDKKINEIIQILKKYQTKTPIYQKTLIEKEKINLNKIVKNSTEIFIKAGEIAGAISAFISLFSM